ncbi:MAG: heme NO-binding domain-containing protein [Planctomycetota bacterium]|jgi:hypothetical protein
MYGLVNKAIEGIIIRDHGEEAWKRIRARAGIEVSGFISNQAYDDAITYELVGAASEELGVGVEDLLVAFGQYWILEIATKSYGPMMQSSGSSLPEFLQFLPQFHTRVALIFPDLEPPTFACTDVSDSSLHLHYHTHRPGLAKFVEGLVLGLGDHYECPVTIRQVEARENGADHDVFLVQWNVAA